MVPSVDSLHPLLLPLCLPVTLFYYVTLTVCLLPLLFVIDITARKYIIYYIIRVHFFCNVLT